MNQNPLHLLCIEPRFPGRLGAVADWLVRNRGYRCNFYCNTASQREHWPESVGQGMEVTFFNVGGVAREPSVAWSRVLERGLCYSYGCWEVLDTRRPRPVDIILGRSAGLGSTLFAPVFAQGIPIVNYFDYYYQPHDHDLAGEADPQTPMEYFHWRRAASAVELLDLESGATPWVPSEWQRGLFPKEYRDDFLVLHDGVDSRRFVRKPAGSRVLAGKTIPPDTLIVTYVSRTVEQLRGFDRFMELANRLLRARSNVICVVVGGSPVTRGLDVQFYNQDYRSVVLQNAPPHDPSRIWFLGEVPQTTVAELLGMSDLHIYPSRAYCVSRSLLEAMSSGCVVLSAETSPVSEIIIQGKTGLLLPPTDLDAWEQSALAVLDNPTASRPLGNAAAEFIRTQYAQDVTLPRLAETFTNLVNQRPMLRTNNP